MRCYYNKADDQLQQNYLISTSPNRRYAKAAAEKPPTPEQIRLGRIERQLKQMLVRLNSLARTVEQHKEKFDEWEKANQPDLDWLTRQNARIPTKSSQPS
jgi:hypothetical protein